MYYMNCHNSQLKGKKPDICYQSLKTSLAFIHAMQVMHALDLWLYGGYIFVYIFHTDQTIPPITIMSTAILNHGHANDHLCKRSAKTYINKRVFKSLEVTRKTEIFAVPSLTAYLSTDLELYQCVM